MLTYFAATEESAKGIAALGINGTAFLIQLVTFVLVFLVLRRFAFGPIVQKLQQRREMIESGVRLGEEMRAKKADFDKTVARDLAKARAEADDIVATAQTEAKEKVRGAENEAQEKAAAIVEEGRARGEQEVVRARKAFQGELVNLISDATETIIDEKVDAKKDAALIDRALKAQNGQRA